MEKWSDCEFTIAVDGKDVSVVQKGSGKDLVCLHGYLSSKEAFVNQVAYFSKFYKVTAFDFLGFGKSGALPYAFSVLDYAEWTQGVLSALDIQKPKIIAHSFGCRVAIKMAGECGQVFDEIILTGPAGVILPRGLGYRCKVLAYRAVKKIAPKFAEMHFGSREYRSLLPIMKESYKKIVNEDLRQDARRIKNRVCIIQGDIDKTTTRREAEAYLACLERGEMKVLDGGHFAFAENALRFNVLAEEFFGNG